MKKAGTIYSLIVSLVTLTILTPSSVKATRFIRKDLKGIHHFVCTKQCGDVRVVRIGQRLYRVFSIPYNGEIKADSFREAADIACKGGVERMQGGNEEPSGRDAACN